MISIRSRSISWILVLTMVFTTLFGNSAMAFANTENTGAQSAQTEEIPVDEVVTHNVSLVVEGEDWGTAELTYKDEAGEDVIIESITLEEAETAEEAIGAEVPEGTEVTLKMEPAKDGRIEAYEPADDLEFTKWQDETTAAEATFTVEEEDVQVEVAFAEVEKVEAEDKEEASEPVKESAKAEDTATDKAARSVVATAIDGTTTLEKEGDTYYIDVKDGSCTKVALYTCFYTLFGSAPASGGNILSWGGDYRYDTEDNSGYSGWRGKTEVKENSDGSATLENKLQYYVARRTGNNSYSASKSFTARTYYNITASLADGSPDGAGVEVENSKVYAGNTATLNINYVANKTAKIYDNNGTHIGTAEKDNVNDTYTYSYRPTASTELVVRYEDVTTYNVSSEKNGTGKGDVTLSPSGPQEEGTEVTVTATPDSNSYVKTITVTGAAIDLTDGFGDNREKTGKFTVGTSDVTVTVTFAEKKLTGNATADVGFNGAKTVAEQKSDLEKAIINAVVASAKLDGTAVDLTKAEGVTVQYKSTRLLSDDVWKDLDWNPSGVDYGYSKFPDKVDGTAEVKITWSSDTKTGTPENSITSTIRLEESRQVATIAADTGYTEENPLKTSDPDEVIAAICEAATINGNKPEDSKVFTIALAEGQTLPGAGEKKELTYNVSVADSTEYLAGSQEIKIWVESDVDPASINVTSEHGTVVLKKDNNDVTDTSYAGELTLTATPDSGYYVGRVKVNGGDALEGTYDNGVFTAKFNVENDKTYNVVVTYGQRTLTAKENPTINYNFYYDVSDKVDFVKIELINKVLAATGGTLDKDNITVYVYNNTINYWYNIKGGFGNLANSTWNASYEDLKIVWEGDDVYPEDITLEVGVNINESRPEVPGIKYTGEGFTVDSRDEITTDAVAEEITHEGTAAGAVNVTFKEGTLPAEGVEGTLIYTVTIDENENYVKTVTDIEVPVKNKEHLTTVKYDSTAVLKDKDGKEIASDTAVKSGDYKLVVTPGDNQYVEGVAVSNENVATLGDGTYTARTYSVPVTIINNATEDTNVSLEATITTMQILGKDLAEGQSSYLVTYNNATAWNEKSETEKDEIYERIIDTVVDKDKSTLSNDGTLSVRMNGTPELGTSTVYIDWTPNNADLKNKYPDRVSAEFSVTFTESRQAADITLTAPDKAVEITSSLDEVKDKVTVDVPTGVEIDNITVDGTLPKQGETKTVAVTVTTKENGTYLANTATVDVQVVGAVKKAKVNVTVGDNGTLTGIESGNYSAQTVENITATPADGYYVDKVTVNGSEINSDQNTLNFTWNQEIKDGTGDALNAAAPEYNINVTFAKREIAEKDPLGTVAFNRYNKPSDQLDTIKAQILAAAVAGDSAGMTVEIWSDGLWGLGRGYYALDATYGILTTNYYIDSIMDSDATQVKVRITLPASGKYPAVVKEVTLDLADSREAAPLNDATIDAMEFRSTSEVEAAIKAAAEGAAVNPQGLTVTYALKDGSTLPKDVNESEDVTYVVTFAGNEKYKAGTAEITVNVTRVAYTCKVTADAAALEGGTITVGGQTLSSKGVAVDGDSKITITAKPATTSLLTNNGIAVTGIRVYKVAGEGETSDTSVETSALTYGNDRTASVTFHTDGKNAEDSYIIYVDYEQGAIIANTNPTITYCYEQQTISAENLQRMVFNAIYDAENSIPKGLTADTNGVKVEYAYGRLGALWAEVGKDPTWEVDGYTHHFGENGTEKIRITYKDSKYGELTKEVELTVIDACYNNTVTVVEENDEKGGTVTVSSAADPATKTYDGVAKYKEKTLHTVTVAPGNGTLDDYPTEAAYVKDIVITDEDGNEVGSDVTFNEADTFFGITYSEPTATATFTTASDEAYTVTVTYGTAKYTVTDEDVILALYEKGTGYEAKVPTAEDIFNAVIKDADPEVMKTYDADKVTVEYSTTKGLTYKTVDDFAGIADGTTVKVRITYNDGSLQYHSVSAVKDVTLKDPRANTEIKTNAVPDIVEYQNNEVLNDTLKKVLEPTVVAGNDTVENAVIDLTATPPVEENGEYYVDVTLTYAGTADYKPATKTIKKIKVDDLPDMTTVTIVANQDHGTVNINGKDVSGTVELLEQSEYGFTVTPKDGWAVDSVTLTENDETSTLAATEENAEEATGTPIELTFKNLVASGTIELGKGKTYTLTVNYVEPHFTVDENASMVFRPGIDNPTDKDVFEAAVIEEESIPQELKENGTLTMKYLAREASSISVEIPGITIGDTVITEPSTIEIPLSEQWLEIGTTVKDVTYEDLIKDYKNAALLATYGCHTFGDQEVEKVKFSYVDNQYKVGETTASIQMVDNRANTALDINETVTVTYNNYDEDAVREGMTEGKAGILADGTTKVEGYLNLEDEVTGLDAGTYEINVSYAGDENNKPCTGTFTLVVEKAPVSINIDSGMYRYGELPKTSITTDPEGVDTITVIAGINVSGITDTDLGNYSTDIYVNMPGTLGSLFKGEVSLSEFKTILETLSAEAAELLGIDQEIIDYLLDLIDQIPGISDTNVTVKINKGTPTDIGVYVVGAVTADSNYKTTGNVGYFVIHPDGFKAELEWNIVDDNGLVTLPYVANGDYDLGASVTNVYEGTIEAAQSKMTYIYFGIDENGEVVMKETTDAQDIGLGAYTQIAYLKDFGNEMYYAKPLIRAMAIVPDLVKIKFTETNAKFEFDGKQHSITAEAYDKDGSRREEWDDQITYQYVGYDGNNVAIYNSDVPPTDVGVYTVIATYRDDEAKRYGTGIGTITIKPADAAITVEDRTVQYTGEAVSSGVTVTPEDCKYITMVAGIDAEGDFATDGIGVIGGAANIDFPERLDKVLKKILPEAYEDGVSVNAILSNTERIAVALEKAGFDAEAIDAIVNFIGQLPQTMLGNAKVTFHDWNEAAPTNTGLYIIGAVTCDPNYKFAADYGYLAIVPDAQKAELSFNMTDDNGVITSKIIKNGTFDFGATATVDGEYSEEAQSYLRHLFIGVDKDGNLVKSTEASSNIGVYTQVAYLADTRTNELYYAAPIYRAYAVVAQLADVQFDNNTGLSKVLYSGEAHAMKATAFGMDGEELNKDNLTIRYIGYDANNIEIYNSTEAPVNVGTYAVLATYADNEDEVYGMNVGSLVIMPADASVAVADYSGAYDKEFSFADLITVKAGESVVTEDKPAYISIVRGIEGEGYLSVEGIDFVNGVVVIDFPDRADKYLQKLVPQLYEGEGIDLVDVALNEAKIREALEKAGFDAEAIDKVMTEVQAAKEVGDVKVRIAEMEDVKAVNIGLYLLTAVTCDPNFQIACDTGLVEVYPNELDGEIIYNQNMPESNVLELDQAEAFDFGAYILDTESGKEITDYNIKNLYYGKTEDGKAYLSTEPPTEVGTYTQITQPLELANNIYILSATRSFSIERITTEITADMEGGIYNGKAYEVKDIAVTDRTGNAVDEDYTVTYTGTRADGEAYESTKAPVDAGEYTVTIRFAQTDRYKASEWTKDFTIAKREITITIAKVVRLCYETKDPEFTATVENEITKGDIKYTLSREEGNTPGTYVIKGTWTNEDYNHVVTFKEGTMTYKDHEAVTDEAVAATCTETGLTEGSHCKVEACGKVLVAQEIIPELGHKTGDWEHDADNHWKTCERCKLPQDKGAHIWDDGVVNKDGTAIIYTCETCEAEHVKHLTKTDISATVSDAEYDGKAHGATDISVTAGEAKPEYKISYTGVTAGGETYESTAAPTQAGKYTVTITVERTNEYQAAEFTKDFEIAQRKIVVTIADVEKCIGEKDPALTAKITKGSLVGDDQLTYELTREAGEKVNIEYKISAQNVSVSDNYDVEFVTGTFLIVLHDYKVVVVAPTCERHGYTKHTCDACGYVKYDNYTEALGHELGDDWENDESDHWKTCGRCELPQKKGAHVWDDGVVNDANTHITYTCTTCGYDVTNELADTTLLATVNDAVYDGKAHGATGIKATSNRVELDYTIHYTGTTTANESYNSENAPTAAGSYTVTITVEATKAYKGAEFTRDFTIAKREITVTIADATRACNATVDPTFTATVENEITKGDIEYTLSREEGNTPGTYAIKGTWTNEDSNHVVKFVNGTMTYKDHKAVTDKAVAATCTETGLTEGSHCSECGTVLKAQQTVPELNHKLGEWEHNANKHWQTCERCEKPQNKADHVWDEGVVNEDGTAVTYTCDTCGAESVKALAKTKINATVDADAVYDGKAHGVTEVTVTAKDAEPTYTVHYTGTTASGESYDSDKAPTEAGKYIVTITVEGTKEYQAAEFTKEFKIAKREITVTIANATRACNEAADPEFTAEITKGSLIGEDQLTYDLTREAGEKIDKDYKIYAENVNVSANYDVTFVNGVLSIAGHDYETVVVDPTCEEQGYTKHTCKVCEYVKYDNITAALGHKTGDWEHDADNHWKTCGRCEEPQDKGSHVWDDGVVNEAKTHITYTCKTCGYDVTNELADTTLLATVNDAVYDGKAHGATGIKATSNGEDLDYTVHYTGTTASGKSYDSAEAPIAAGSYTVTVTVEATKAYKGAEFTRDFTIAKREITVTIADAVRACDATVDPTFTATVENELTKGEIEFELSREEGDTPNTYAIKGTWTNEDSNYVVIFKEGTMTYKDHRAVTDKAVAATCTTKGKTEGSHCGDCGEVLVAQKTIAATGHKTGAWKKNATYHWHVCKNCNKVRDKAAHKWGKGVVNSKKSTITYTCKTCGYKKVIKTKQTDFGILSARATKATNKTITVKWTKVKDADGYIIYGSKCGKKTNITKLKKLKTVSAKTTSYKVTKLKKATSYKYRVVAYKNVNGKKVTIATSKVIHQFTTGGKYSNATAVKVNKTKVTLKKGKTFKVKASEVKPKNKKLQQHRAIAFETTNKKVATVTSKGVIKAKGKGTCYVYAYGQNGSYKKIKVTVK